MLPIISTDTNLTCPLSLLWSPAAVDSQQPVLYICIIAAVTHSIFWLQLIFCSSVRQKTMQWLYAYLATDILLLVRFFIGFIVHTTSNECIPNRAWSLFICYFEGAFDNYLNILEVYILLALNLCRYAQIARNKNVYVTNVRLLIFAHLVIYLMPLINFIIQLSVGWAQLEKFVGDSCDVSYTNMYAQIMNTIIAFILPIGLNILVIYASIHHIHSIARLRRTRHYVSAREKYHRSLVIQFLVFYTVWLLLWSPNVVIYQFTSSISTVTRIGSLLNYIEIALDPIIIAALDVRFWQVWRNIWIRIKNRFFMKLQPQRRQIQPIENHVAIPLPQLQQIMAA